MKKKNVLILLSALLIFLCSACAGKNGSEGTRPADEKTEESGSDGSSEENEVADGIFKVGYSRVNITPEGYNYPLAGYGRTDKRLSQGLLDYIYATCVSFIDENGTKFLMFSYDIIGVSSFKDGLIEACMKEFNMPEENILVVATHTHSMVDCGQDGFSNVAEYKKVLVAQGLIAAQESFADVKPAKMYWNTVDLEGYNFVRHYISEKGMAVGDNHNSGDAWNAGTLVKHATEGNHVMYMVKFEREEAETILLCNWRAHATLTGGSSKTDVSADFVGSVRTALEKETGVKFVYFQGEAGNQNPRTRLGSEFNPPSDFKKYGSEVSGKIATVYAEDTWEEIPLGPIVTTHEIAEAPANHSRDALAGVAKSIRTLWNKDGMTAEVQKMLIDNQIYSPYECSAIVNNCARGKTVERSLHATMIGDLILTNEESEMFDTNGTFVRDNSPSKYTIVMSYTDGNGYIPSKEAFEYGCYEADCSHFAPGAGEILASQLVDMANKLWEQRK